MKKIGVVTLQGNYNFGNRLQNYALLKVLKDMGFDAYNIIDNNIILTFKNIIKKIIKGNQKGFDKNRQSNFKKFSNKMKEIKCLYYTNKCKMPRNIESEFYRFIVGSDQVWNFDKKVVSKYMLDFTNTDKKISYAASFGKSQVDKKLYSDLERGLNDFNFISVREEEGKKIIEDIIKRRDIEVLIDPTMLLSISEWNKVAQKPKQYSGEKYILNYFLGDLSEEKKNEIDRIAIENNCDVINILDKNSKYYDCGPSEFVFLIKNAFFVCTDSFHSAVFSFLYDKSFIIFDREQKNIENMNSRLNTLINKFNLENRYFTGKITENNLHHDYTKSFEILEKERKKSYSFLSNALLEKDGD